MTRDEALKKFLNELPFEFDDRTILEGAFVHSSYLNELAPGPASEEVTSNERLEFLGDSVLAIVISDMLYRRYPELPEGELTKLRSRLINRRTLAEVATKLGLGELLLMGKGETRGGGRENPAILADTVEALLAAIYMDRGLMVARDFIETLFIDIVDTMTDGPGYFDYKPALQELTQGLFKKPPVYRLVNEDGPPHKRVFLIEAVVDGSVMGRGEASRKKDAEQLAAREAIEKLEEKKAK